MTGRPANLSGKVLGVLGIIVLGALGSGLWELIKPLFGWAWSVTLTIATLGIDSLRDGIYEDTVLVHLRRHKAASLSSLAALICLTGGMIISSLRLSYQPTTASRLPLVAETLLVVMALVLIVTSSRMTYVEGLAAYTAKLEAIAAPYISDVELEHFRARAVQVTSRAEYLANVDALQKVIERAGQKASSREFF